MAKLHAEFKDGRISIDLEDIKEDEAILRELAKTVVFDKTLMECFAKLLVSDRIEYEDEPAGWPYGWWSTWSGKGQVFEAMRQIVSQKADETAQKLVEICNHSRDEMDLYFFGDEGLYIPGETVIGEWCGPLMPPEETL
jgi:hypothetical protein